MNPKAVIPACAGMTKNERAVRHAAGAARVLARGDRLRRGRDIAARGGSAPAEMLDYRDDPALQRESPNVVVDLGCGPGRAAAAMQKRWPKARVLALDLALPMLRETRSSSKR